MSTPVAVNTVLSYGFGAAALDGPASRAKASESSGLPLPRSKSGCNPV